MNDKSPEKKDLVILVPDKDIESGIKTLLDKRQKSLRTRNIKYKFLNDWQGDSHCYTDAHETLRPFINKFSFAIVLFDKEGCGREDKTIFEIESDVMKSLNACGWEGKSAVVVFEPEFESLVWSDSSNVDDALGWHGKSPNLRDWMVQKGFLKTGEVKPKDPKSALIATLHEANKAWSSTIFVDLAESVGLNRCQDPNFARLTQILQNWFPDTE